MDGLENDISKADKFLQRRGPTQSFSFKKRTNSLPDKTDKFISNNNELAKDCKDMRSKSHINRLLKSKRSFQTPKNDHF